MVFGIPIPLSTSSPPSSFRRGGLVSSCSWFHVFSLSLLPNIGGAVYGWAPGVKEGVGNFLVATAIISVAYGLLLACLGELAAAFPFSGGSYGYARATLSGHASFLVGLAEALVYICVAAFALISMGPSISILLGTQSMPELEVLYHLLFLTLLLYPAMRGGRAFWSPMLVATWSYLIVFVIFMLACICNYGGDFSTNARLLSPASGAPLSGSDAWFANGGEGFFSVLPTGLWWFIGVELCPLAAEETIQPRVNLPIAMRRTAVVQSAFAFLTLFAITAMPDFAALQGAAYPFQGALQILINGEADPNSSRFSYNWHWVFLTCWALLLILYSQIFAFSRQIFSLARAGHLAPFLARLHCSGPGSEPLPKPVAAVKAAAPVEVDDGDYENADVSTMNRVQESQSLDIGSPSENNGRSEAAAPRVDPPVRTPRVAILFGSLLVYLLCVIVRLGPDFDTYCDYVFDVLVCSSFFTYSIMLASFIKLRLRFDHVPRPVESRSPFGVAGAVVCGIIFLMAFISMCIYRKAISAALITIAIVLVGAEIYYYSHVRHHLQMSPEEKCAVLMRLTVEKILSTPLGYSYLMAQCVKDSCGDTLSLWKALDDYFHIYHQQAAAPPPQEAPLLSKIRQVFSRSNHVSMAPSNVDATASAASPPAAPIDGGSLAPPGAGGSLEPSVSSAAASRQAAASADAARNNEPPNGKPRTNRLFSTSPIRQREKLVVFIKLFDEYIDPLSATHHVNITDTLFSDLNQFYEELMALIQVTDTKSARRPSMSKSHTNSYTSLRAMTRPPAQYYLKHMPVYHLAYITLDPRLLPLMKALQAEMMSQLRNNTLPHFKQDEATVEQYLAQEPLRFAKARCAHSCRCGRLHKAADPPTLIAIALA